MTCVRAKNFIHTDNIRLQTVDSLAKTMVTFLCSNCANSITEPSYVNSFHVSYHVNRSAQYKHIDLQVPRIL